MGPVWAGDEIGISEGEAPLQVTKERECVLGVLG